MLPAPHPCGGAAAPAGWLSPSGITKSAPVPRFRRPKHSSFCRVIVAARARSTSLQLPILDCRLYFTGQHRKNQYFFAGPHNFFAAACALYLSPAGRVPRPRVRVTFGGSDLPAFLFDASGGPISSSSGRNGGKNAAKNQWFLDFLLVAFDAVGKGSAGNRPWAYPRCR